MASDGTGPGQRYAIAARKHIAELRRKEPEIWIEIRWCPRHCGVKGNEKADEWAKRASNEPDAHGTDTWTAVEPPCSLIPRANMKLAARFYRFKMGHCLRGQYLQWTTPYGTKFA